MFVHNKDSMGALISNSSFFQDRFDINVAKAKRDDTTRALVKNLGFARHRFDSVAKPLGRMVANIDALIATALQIAGERRGKREGIATELFLVWLDTERCLQAALMSDALDECMAFTRFLDDEEFDTSQLSAEVAVLISKLRFLFENQTDERGGDFQNCWHLGYTQVMMQHLRKVKTYFVRGNAYSLGVDGEIPADMKRRCVQRMQVWLAVAIQVLESEFPSWEIVQAFRILHLNEGGRARAAVTRDDDAARLASICGVDAAELKAEIMDVTHHAAQVYRTSSGLTTFESWRQAVRRIQTSRLRHHKKTDNLVALLARRLPQLVCTCIHELHQCA